MQVAATGPVQREPLHLGSDTEQVSPGRCSRARRTAAKGIAGMSAGPPPLKLLYV